MCLNISTKAHPAKNREGGKIQPRARNRYFHNLTAERDIVVYKVLDNAGTLGAYSPFQYTLWTFGKLKKARMAKAKIAYYAHYSPVISIALHAFTHIKASRCVSLLNNRGSGTKVYPAVIPKGSRLFFGERGEIASDAMIVYRNADDLVKVHGPVAKPVHYARLAK